jgi:hypothetical protein
VVEQVGAQVSKVQPGDHVVLSYNACGLCGNCQAGRAAYCEQVIPCNFGGKRLDGSTTLHKETEPIHGVFFGQSSFATYALASERNVVKVRPEAPLEILGPLGCGIQTGAGAVLNSLQARAGTSIAIFGVGSVGLSAVMAAVVAGCTTIIALDVQPQRLALARELGASHTLNLTGVTIHTERGIGISLVRGDENTGLPPPLAPKVERPAGHVARSYLQGQLGSPLPECRFDWHFLVHHLASDKPTAELSLPLIADQNDGVLSWSERIEIDTTSLPPSPPQADSPHQPSTGPADDTARLPLPLAEPKDWSDK